MVNRKKMFTEKAIARDLANLRESWGIEEPEELLEKDEVDPLAELFEEDVTIGVAAAN